MDIDWNSAPAEATHFDIYSTFFCSAEGWWDRRSNYYPDNRQAGWGTDRYVPRPTAGLDRNAFTDPVSELLAVIHRDGGQYEDTHGRDQAIRDAYGEVYELRQQLAEAKRVIKIIADLDLKSLAS